MEYAEGMDFTESRSEKLYREDRTVNLDKAMERTKKALDGALVENEMRWFDNGPVIAVPSFEAGRIASIVQTRIKQGSRFMEAVRVCKVSEPGESAVCKPDEAAKLVQRYLVDAGRYIARA